MNCVSCDICVYHLGLCVFFPGVFLISRVSGACPVTTDFIMRVNVRRTTIYLPGTRYILLLLCACTYIRTTAVVEDVLQRVSCMGHRS